MTMSLKAMLRGIRTNTNEPRPARDWLLVLACSGLLLAGTVVWSVQLFQKVVSGEVLDTQVLVEKARPKAKESPVASVQALYEARAAEAAKYGAGVYVYEDPSQ